MTKNKKFPIVLTADRTLMSEYNSAIFIGFSACVPKGLVPDRAYFNLFCPPIEVNDDGSVKLAHCGTRKIEAALMNYGFTEEDVVVAHPEHLDRVVGPETKALGITENDPLGIGPATSTFTEIFGGEAYMAIKFKELINHPAIQRFKPRILVGGPGAWQLEGEEIRKAIGIDTVVIGEGEKVAGPLFEKALKDDPLPRLVYGEVVEEDEIPIIRGATLNGLVEIARGCGRGCDFCVPTLQRFRCLSLDHILREVEVNLGVGRQPLLHAEDVLRYKAHGVEVNGEAVTDLFKTIMNYPGVNKIEISHLSLASVASAPRVVEEIADILKLDRKHWSGVQTGIETGSPRLMDYHMKGKCRPFEPKSWPQTVVDAFQVLSDDNLLPCSTLIIGLPKETPEDIILTMNLVEKLKQFKSLIVPLYFVETGGLKGKSKSFTFNDATPVHNELLLKCWEHNLEWIKTIFEEWAPAFIKNVIARRGLKIVASHGIRETGRLIEICKKEYNYDLRTMINDIRKGEMKAMPLSARMLRPIFS